MNNVVSLCGRVISDPELTNRLYPNKNILFMLDMLNDGTKNAITRVIVSNRIFNVGLSIKKGDVVYINGSFASFIVPEENRAHKFLYVFAREIKVFKESSYFLNRVTLIGTISGKINQSQKKMDFNLLVKSENCIDSYIPCVVPCTIIDYVRKLQLKQHDILYYLRGYINSREYIDRQGRAKVAYEIVADNIEEFID